MINTSRSTIETGQRCLRKRFWEYHYVNPGMPSPGLQGKKPSLEMSLGTAVHLGCEMLARYAMADKMCSIQLSSVPANVLDMAVKEALSKFSEIWDPWIEWAAASQDRESYTDDQDREGYATQQAPLLSYQLAEAPAMVEALIALFYYHPNGLRLLLDNYEILAIEPELQIPFTDWLTFQSRPDLIIRHKRTELVYSLDLKTSRSWDDRAEKSAATDNQGIGQAIAVKHFTGENSSGEIRLVLIKEGKRTEADGIYRATSGLIRPYKDTTALFGGVESLAFDSYYTCPVEHEWKWAKAGYKVNGKNYCPGGQPHKRGDNYQRVNLWEEGIPVRNWVKYLVETEPDTVAKLIAVPVAFPRTEGEIESWKRQVKHQENRVSEGTRVVAAYAVANKPGFDAVEVLDEYFPQSRTSCSYPSPCPMYNLCHNDGAARLLDPELFQPGNEALAASVVDELGYVARINNHPIEDPTNVS